MCLYASCVLINQTRSRLFFQDQKITFNGRKRRERENGEKEDERVERQLQREGEEKEKRMRKS